MKPKLPNGARGRSPRGKAVKKEVHSPNTINLGHFQTARPSVEITKCISFQKFRYSGENRPGKKYQEKEFMDLRLSELNDRVVRIVIICTDAENRELIHPNGLVGKDCHDGIYDKEYAITRSMHDIKIPYLRTERIKTKKHESDNIQNVLEKRARHLPSPYKERCLSQCNDRCTSARKFDTTKVCLGVIVTIVSHQGSFNGSLHAISHVVRNASEKTTLDILKLCPPFVSASEGGIIDIFTTETGPEIEAGKYFVSVGFEDDRYGEWRSENVAAGKETILYKRIITYHVPPFALSQNLTSPVNAVLNLECPQSNQYCSCEFTYKPHNDVSFEEHIQNQLKRSLVEDVKPSPKRLRIAEDDYDVEQRNTIKTNLQNKLRARQDSSYELSKDESNGYAVSHQAAEVVLSSRQTTAGVSPIYVVPNMHQGQNTDAIISDNTDFMKSQGFQANPSSLTDGRQDMEVVATGYSDKVPPDTTVFIYTTSEGLTADTLTETVQDNQVILQEIPQKPNHLSDIHFSDNVKYVQDSKKNNVHILSPDNVHVFSPMQSNVSQEQECDINTNENNYKTLQSAGSDLRMATSSTKPLIMSSSIASGITSSDNIIRRMVVPPRSQQISPWEVASDEDNLAAVLFSSNGKSNSAATKKDYTVKEPVEVLPQLISDNSKTVVLSERQKSSPVNDSKSAVQSVVSVSSSSQSGEKSNSKENPMMNLIEGVNFQDYDTITSVDASEIAKRIENYSLSAINSVKSTLLSGGEEK